MRSVFAFFGLVAILLLSSDSNAQQFFQQNQPPGCVRAPLAAPAPKRKRMRRLRRLRRYRLQRVVSCSCQAPGD